MMPQLLSHHVSKSVKGFKLTAIRHKKRPVSSISHKPHADWIVPNLEQLFVLHTQSTATDFNAVISGVLTAHGVKFHHFPLP